MSKSKGNLVEFASELEEHGADVIRVAMAFAGPPEDDIDWSEVSLVGSSKFIARALRVAQDVSAESVGKDPADGDQGLRKHVHKILAEMPELLEGFKFNVAIARLMELVNITRKAIDSGAGAADAAVREAAEALARLMSIFAPYAGEEMWELLGGQFPVARAGIPVVEESLLVEDTIVAVFQVNGKLRDTLEVSTSITEEELTALAKASSSVNKAIGDLEIVRTIVRAPKLVNFVAK